MFLGKKKACIAIAVLTGTLLQALEALKDFNYIPSTQSRAAGAALLCGFSCCVGMGVMGCIWLVSGRKTRMNQLAREALMQVNQELVAKNESLAKSVAVLKKELEELENKLKSAKNASQEQPKKRKMRRHLPLSSEITMERFLSQLVAC